MTPDEHTVKLYTSRRQSWAECKCGWKSVNFGEKSTAQRAWSVHLTQVLKAQSEGLKPHG